MRYTYKQWTPTKYGADGQSALQRQLVAGMGTSTVLLA